MGNDFQSQIEIVNFVPKFLAFFEEAEKTDGKVESIFPLWEQLYGFAAVPPGEEGRKIARQLLKDAWPKYKAAIRKLADFEPNKNEIISTLEEVKGLLNYNENISMNILFFVGSFERNPFVAPSADGRMTLCLPVETELTKIELVHELTHIVHAEMAKFSMSWERTIAVTVMQEGLAMRVSEAIVPGGAEELYTTANPGWLKEAKGKQDEMIQGILPYLDHSSSEAVMKFTFGPGTTGLEREAYFVGWQLVGQLVREGYSFAELARISEEEAPLFIRRHLEKLI